MSQPVDPDSLSSMLPNVSAPVGQLCAQAVVNSPSRTFLPSSLALSFADRIRWMQKVHFSIIPTSRTCTSGFTIRSEGSGQWCCHQLNRRTL